MSETTNQAGHVLDTSNWPSVNQLTNPLVKSLVDNASNLRLGGQQVSEWRDDSGCRYPACRWPGSRAPDSRDMHGRPWACQPAKLEYIPALTVAAVGAPQ